MSVIDAACQRASDSPLRLACRSSPLRSTGVLVSGDSGPLHAKGMHVAGTVYPPVRGCCDIQTTNDTLLSTLRVDANSFLSFFRSLIVASDGWCGGGDGDARIRCRGGADIAAHHRTVGACVCSNLHTVPPPAAALPACGPPSTALPAHRACPPPAGRLLSCRLLTVSILGFLLVCFERRAMREEIWTA